MVVSAERLSFKEKKRIFKRKEYSKEKNIERKEYSKEKNIQKKYTRRYAALRQQKYSEIRSTPRRHLKKGHKCDPFFALHSEKTLKKRWERKKRSDLFFVQFSRNGEVRSKTSSDKLLVRRLHRVILDGYAQRLCSCGDPTDSSMPCKAGRRRDV